MSHRMLARTAFAISLLVASALLASAQITIDGVTDRANYNDTVTYRVQTQAGFSYAAFLNGQPVPTGVSNTITRPDFYELFVQRTDNTSSAVTTRMVRFLVNASERAGSEWGLPPHTPLPLVQSSAQEFSGARLRLVAPQNFPTGYEVPVIAWAVDEGGHAVRANGLLAAAGHPSIQLRRGVGSGFLSSNNPPGTMSYTPNIGGVSTNKTINIEATTTWTTVSGNLGNTVWADNSRIHVVGDLTVPAGVTLRIGAGTIVRLDQKIGITNNGSVEIGGSLDVPVVFMPTVKGQPWGGFIQHANNAQFVATGTIFTGSGYEPCWYTGEGCPPAPSGIVSHRGEQALVSLVGANCNLTMTDCAAIDLAGQLGHSLGSSANYSYNVTLTRFLLQRATTGGEFTRANFTVNDSAFIECPDDTPHFENEDNDALYLVSGTHNFTNTLFGWTKDDGIDSGGDGVGRLHYEQCWFEATFHEGNSLSGLKNTTAHRTVYYNCGQGIEDGYGAGSGGPTGRVDTCLFLVCKSGVRHGDNYPSIGNGYPGIITATNCILLDNHRDLFGYNWRTTGFTNAWGQFFANNNFLTRTDTNFPNNFVWNPAADAARLMPFGAAGRVGVALAVWPGITALTNFLDGVPVALSMFSTNDVSVNYLVETGDGPGTTGTLVFTPGQVLKFIPAPANLDGAMRVTLSSPQNADLTGASQLYFQSFIAVPQQTTPLVRLGSVWKFLDDATDQGTAWRTNGFNDAAWRSGPAELGFGETDQVTLVASNRQVTTYFRHTFTVANPAEFGSLAMRLRRDDAGVVHINGTEAYRSPNLPQTGAIVYGDFASPNGENTIDQATLPASLLKQGLNIVAVEIHQGDLTSSDLSFDFELNGLPSGAVRVEIGRFGNDAALFWRDGSYRLQQSTDLNSNNWSTLPGSSPLPVNPAESQRFFRLTK